jgi:hypothetical protein
MKDIFSYLMIVNIGENSYSLGANIEKDKLYFGKLISTLVQDEDGERVEHLISDVCELQYFDVPLDHDNVCNLISRILKIKAFS